MSWPNLLKLVCFRERPNDPNVVDRRCFQQRATVTSENSDLRTSAPNSDRGPRIFRLMIAAAVAGIGVWIPVAYFSDGTQVHWQDFVILVFPALFLPFAFWLFTYRPPSRLKPGTPPTVASGQSQLLQLVVTGALGATVLQFSVAGMVQRLAAGAVCIVVVLIAFWANTRLRK